MTKLTLTSAAVLALLGTTSAFSSSESSFYFLDTEQLSSLRAAYPGMSDSELNRVLLAQQAIDQEHASAAPQAPVIPSHTLGLEAAPTPELSSFDPGVVALYKEDYPHATDEWLARKIVSDSRPTAGAPAVDFSHMPMASVVLTHAALRAGLEVPMAALSILPTREQAAAINMENTTGTQGFKDWAASAGIDLSELTHASYYPLVEMYREHLAANSQAQSDEDDTPYYGSDGEELSEE